MFDGVKRESLSAVLKRERKSNADAKGNEGAIIFTHYINLLEIEVEIEVEINVFKNLKSTDLA